MVYHLTAPNLVSMDCNVVFSRCEEISAPNLTLAQFCKTREKLLIFLVSVQCLLTWMLLLTVLDKLCASHFHTHTQKNVIFKAIKTSKVGSKLELSLPMSTGQNNTASIEWNKYLFWLCSFLFYFTGFIFANIFFIHTLVGIRIVKKKQYIYEYHKRSN